ncbi:3184_t:CDS:1, partial [Cetraspora pellucida]
MDDDNEINVEDYFEEVYRGSINMEERSTNVDTVILREGELFPNFDEAEQCIQQYAEFKGFKIRLGQHTMIETEDRKTMRKRTILCHHSGRYQLTNPTKVGKSVKTECLWHINLSQPFKQNPNNYVYVTTLKDKHNHGMCPEALQFEKDKVFTEEMQEDVGFYVTQCHFGATLIWKILKQKYPSHLIFSKDLYNEIRKYKPSVQVNE